MTKFQNMEKYENNMERIHTIRYISSTYSQTSLARTRMALIQLIARTVFLVSSCKHSFKVLQWKL